MKSIFRALLFFLTISCGDIKNYNMNDGNLNSYFTRKFGSIGYDYGWSLDHSPFDNGIIITGSQEKEIGGDKQLIVIKTNSIGLVIWERLISGKGNTEGYDVISTSDGGYLIVGYSWNYGNAQQIYILKLDFYGDIEWEKNYGGSVWDVGNSVIELKDGGFAIAGFSNSPGISSGNTDMILLKIDKYGNKMWMKAYGNKGFPNHEKANDLIELFDKSIIMVGYRDRYDNGGKNSLILRVDKNGLKLWEKELLNENQTDEMIYSISASQANSIYLSVGANSIGNSEEFYPKIIKIDSYGNIDWVKKYKSNSAKYHNFNITTAIDGDILLVGSTKNNVAFGQTSDAFITRLNSEGKIIWSKSYGTEDWDDWGWSIIEKPDGNIAMLGSTKSFNASLFDIFLIGTSSSGY